ncbi:MAG TPA: uroporphyrinogen-III C-methyltransferase [Tepidisphaeraceae bacterium]|nr:uroporphyrinogen-III C-methyltransferase [Tepidisphaeraceae bacterium]
MLCIDSWAAQSHGIVYLVGAGPGDPGLITVRGRELLESAEVVIYDALANPRLLSHCKDAELIYAGKQAAAHSMTQDAINALLVEKGRAGKRVVRLKGGDPFVFGRGGEECEALAAAGLRFEVVPGITAAIAAPAYAGIPVTHRDFNSSFTLLTGHEREETYQDAQAADRSAGAGSHLDYDALAKLPCLAFYMGVKSLPRICDNLIAHGMSPLTPAATISHGTSHRQKTVVATLVDLPTRVAEAGLTPPALTIIGKVVALRDRLAWFENRPLFGQTIAVTRTRQQASELTAALSELGADVIEAPTIELRKPADFSGVDSVLANAAAFDWIIFTSQNGVSAVKERLLAIGRDTRLFGNAAIAAIGQATANAVRQELCLRVHLCPDQFVAEALADALEAHGEISAKRFLLLRADIARPLLRDRLIAGGAAEVQDIAVYETHSADALPPELLAAMEQRRLTWITFTSSSTAKNFAALLGPDYRQKLQAVRLASIGPITSQTLRELGLAPAIEAEQFSIPGLVAALIRHDGGHGGG